MKCGAGTLAEQLPIVLREVLGRGSFTQQVHLVLESLSPFGRRQIDTEKGGVLPRDDSDSYTAGSG